jgi:D-alanine-D-alanine ligase
MHVAVLYNRVAVNDSASDLDVLKQCVAVEESLRQLGHSTSRIRCDLDLDSVRRQLIEQSPRVVFNLVESLGGTDRLMPAAAILLESLNLPYTGASCLAMLQTTGKLVAKQRMVDHELPTPAWLMADASTWQGLQNPNCFPDSVIIKAIAEHASLGLRDDSVVSCRELTTEDLALQMLDRSNRHRTPHFAEQYIDGREFNLSVLASDDGPEVLPPAEIQFLDYPEGKPKIVGENAKWNEHTSEYINTPRRFDFPHGDQPLLDELEALARRCWIAFDLHGYARVDFRVDADGQPWILEINANPCLSPDAGFAAAVAEAGLTFNDVVRRVLNDALRQ